jgi:hypothetical protein
MVSAKKEHKHNSRKAHKSEKNKKRARADSSSSSSSSSSADEGAQRSRGRKRSRTETILPRAHGQATASSINATQITALPQELCLLVNMLFTFPALPPELVELLHALDSGESVCLDGVSDAALKRQLSEFLAGIGVHMDATTSGSHIFKPHHKVSYTIQTCLLIPAAAVQSDLSDLQASLLTFFCVVLSCCTGNY